MAMATEEQERERTGRDPSRPVYVISVAAELVEVHPRTLRIYEGEGLICPARTRGLQWRRTDYGADERY